MGVGWARCGRGVEWDLYKESNRRGRRISSRLPGLLRGLPKLFRAWARKELGGPPGASGSRGLPGHSRRSRAPSCNPALPGSGAPAPGAPGLRRSQPRGRLRALRYALPIHCLKPRPEPNPLHQLPPAAPIRSRGLFRGLPGRPGGRPSGGCPDAVPGLPEPPGAASPFPPPSQAPSGTPCARH